MKHCVETWKRDSIESLIKIPEAQNFLYKNVYVKKNSSGKLESDFMSPIDACLKCFINEGELKKYDIEDSISIKYIYGNLNLPNGLFIDKSRKSFNVYDWIISRDFDSITGIPKYKITSPMEFLENQKGNVTLKIRKINNKKELYLNFSKNIKLNDKVKVLYKTDANNKIQEEYWSVSTTYDAAFYQNDVNKFIDILKKEPISFLESMTDIIIV